METVSEPYEVLVSHADFGRGRGTAFPGFRTELALSSPSFAVSALTAVSDSLPPEDSIPERVSHNSFFFCYSSKTHCFF